MFLWQVYPLWQVFYEKRAYEKWFYDKYYWAPPSPYAFLFINYSWIIYPSFTYFQGVLSRSKSTEHLGGYNTADDTDVSTFFPQYGFETDFYPLD